MIRHFSVFTYLLNRNFFTFPERSDIFVVIDTANMIEMFISLFKIMIIRKIAKINFYAYLHSH